MVTILLTVSIGLLLGGLLAWGFVLRAQKRREPVYVCDICNSRDCVCRKKP